MLVDDVRKFTPLSSVSTSLQRLLMSEHRALLQAEYQGLLQQSGADGVVSTTFNTSAHWLREKGFFSDMKRNNDITYYVVGRGHKGVDPVTGEEFAFQVQPMGGNSLYGKNHYCVPRAHGVSAGEEKVRVCEERKSRG